MAIIQIFANHSNHCAKMERGTLQSPLWREWCTACALNMPQELSF